jgi:hypothetical protein
VPVLRANRARAQGARAERESLARGRRALALSGNMLPGAEAHRLCRLVRHRVCGQARPAAHERRAVRLFVCLFCLFVLFVCLFVRLFVAGAVDFGGLCAQEATVLCVCLFVCILCLCLCVVACAFACSNAQLRGACSLLRTRTDTRARTHTHADTRTHARSRTRTHAHRYIPGVFEKHSNNVGGAFCLLVVCLFVRLFVCLVVSSAVVPSRFLLGKSASCNCIPKVF